MPVCFFWSSRYVSRSCALIGAILILCATAVLAEGAASQPTKTADWEQACKDEIERLDKQNPSADMKSPEMWEWSKRCMPEFQKFMLIGAQMGLGTLGYGTGPFNGILDDKTKRAIKAYQQNRGLSATGELDLATSDKISADIKTVNADPPHLPPFLFTDAMWDQYVSAEGTFVIEGEKQGMPLQTSKITCWRSWNACVEATASIFPSDWSIINVDMDFHEIERWDEHEIVTKPDDKLCVRYSMRISRMQKSVAKLRSTIDQGPACKGIVENRDFEINLVGGSEAEKGLDEQKLKKLRELIKADWRAIDALKDMYKRLDSWDSAPKTGTGKGEGK